MVAIRLQNSLCWKQVSSLPLAFGLPNCFSVVGNLFFCPGIVNLVALPEGLPDCLYFQCSKKTIQCTKQYCLIKRFSFSSTEHLWFHDHYNFLISSLSFAFFCTWTTVQTPHEQAQSQVLGWEYLCSPRSCSTPAKCYRVLPNGSWCYLLPTRQRNRAKKQGCLGGRFIIPRSVGKNSQILRIPLKFVFLTIFGCK